tara:strand:- start:40 stop:570 length:531 start_codon:yes stop_codon:yes gene_type:complete
MITQTHIKQLDNIEGEFLFIIDSDITPATGAYHSSVNTTQVRRKYNLICTNESKQWNKVKDLANNVVNYIQCTSYTAKGDILKELKNLDDSKLSLVYIDLGKQKILKEVLDILHNKFSKSAKIIVKSLDSPQLIDYINEYKLNLPAILPNGYISFTNEERAFILGTKVSRSKSNNF